MVRATTDATFIATVALRRAGLERFGSAFRLWFLESKQTCR